MAQQVQHQDQGLILREIIKATPEVTQQLLLDLTHGMPMAAVAEVQSEVNRENLVVQVAADIFPVHLLLMVRVWVTE